MTGGEKPCCAAEALRRIRQIDVGGHPIGLAMLDAVLGEVIALHLSDDGAIGDELLRRVRIYNYIPPGAEEEYRIALLAEYRRQVKGHG